MGSGTVWIRRWCGRELQSSGERDAWFQRTIESNNIDGVLFFIPFEDDLAGWDYPRQAAWLNQQRVPNVLIRDINDEAAVAAFIGELSRN